MFRQITRVNSGQSDLSSFRSSRMSRITTLATALSCMLCAGCGESSFIDPDPNFDGVAEKIVVTDEEVTHEEIRFNEALKAAGDKTVVVDFWADFCEPCHMMAPEIEHLAVTRDDIVVLKVNTAENRTLAMHFQIQAIPAIRIFKNNRAEVMLDGFMSAEDIEAKLP